MIALRFSPEALKDLDETWEYIAAELCNSDAVGRAVNAILDAVERLREHPYIGAPLNSISRIESDCRFVIAGHFLSFYRVWDGAVYVDRVLYERLGRLRVLLNKEH